MNPPEQSFVAELDRMLLKLAIFTGYSNVQTLQKHLTSVFQVIRQRTSFEDSLKFIDILPVPFKALFLDKWQIPATAPRPFSDMDDLTETIICGSNHAISTPTEARQLLRKLFTFFGQFTSHEQLRQGLTFLPDDFQALLMSDPKLKYQSSDTCIWLS